MFPKVTDPNIRAETKTVCVAPGVDIYVKIISGPARSGRTAIYVHGGGGGGNHTLIERPSRKLIADGFFDRVILPDRRGDGASSPITRPLTIREHAEDMRALLDQLGEQGPLTAMGVSYGGPIALDLAAIDPRVDRVVLVASSPTLSEVNGVARFLLKSGILKPMMKASFRRNLGKLPPAYPDFDPAYDAARSTDLIKIFSDALKRTPLDRLDSLLYSLEATLDATKAGVPEDVCLSIPVIQIVGEKDEVWGNRILPVYAQRFPRFRQYIVPGGKIHKDVFLKPIPFYNALARGLGESGEVEGRESRMESRE